MKRVHLMILPLLLLGLLVLCFSLAPSSGSSGRPGSTHTTDALGAAALERWLQELGYETRRMEYEELLLSSEDSALVILYPRYRIDFDEAFEIMRWVEAGGTLLLIERPDLAVSQEVYDLLALEMAGDELLSGQATVSQPLLYPPTGPVDLSSALAVISEISVAPVLTLDGRPVLVAATYGRGLAYVGAAEYLLTNAALKNDDQAALALNLLSRVPPGGRVVFDEIHHGFVLRPDPAVFEEPSPLGRLPLWRGLLYALGMVAVYIALTGRRFGRPVPVRQDVARRTSGEYVQSMAGLLERGAKSEYALRHYRDQLKRRLARPYGFNPRMADADFVRELARFQPIDETRLGQLLGQLSQPAVGPATLLRLVGEADRLAAEIEQGRHR